MKKIIFLFFILFLLTFSFATADVFFSEILFNPLDGNEFIELYTLNVTNFSNVKLKDNLHTDEITCCDMSCSFIVPSQTYVLIVDQDSTLYYEPTSIVFCVDDRSIGNGLGNSYDNITLYRENGKDDSLMLDSNIFFSYYYEVSTQKGNSLSLINGTFVEKISTPGFQNTPIVEDVDEDISENMTNNDISQNETEINVTIEQNVTTQINDTFDVDYNTTESEDDETIENEEEINETDDPSNLFDLGLYEEILDTMYIDVSYKLFKIKNEVYPEINDHINVSLYYNISQKINESNILIFENTAFGTLKSYTSSLVKYSFNTSQKYQICGSVVSLSHNETHTGNNNLCFNASIIDSSNIVCNVSLHLDVNDYIIDEGNKISFDHVLSNETFPFEITYSVQDLFGTIVKKEVSTSNTNKKSYTPKIDELDKVLIIQSALTKLSCNNTENNTKDEYLFIVKGGIEVISSSSSSDSSSSITINTIKSAKFGDVMNVDVDIYKGNTAKYAIKAYILHDDKKISKTTSFHAKKKNQEYSLSLPIILDSDCDLDTDTYTIVIEGLGVTEKKKATIQAGNCDDSLERVDIGSSLSLQKTLSSKSQYSLLYVSNNLTSSLFSTVVEISNVDNITHEYDVWSYLYNGRTSYTGDRKKNIQEIRLLPEERKIIVLPNELEDPLLGEYKLKVNILRDDRKTPYEFKEQIYVNVNETREVLVENSVQQNQDSTSEYVTISKINESGINDISGNVVYESTTRKMHGYIVYGIICILAIFGYLYWKKELF